MSARKRHLDVGHSSRKSKKVKLSADSDTGGVDGEQASPALPSESVDFPRGGGTNLTPLEVKAARTEAVKEANDELFAVSAS
jgi:rRNA biogenesis protein RRP5